jgi:hypothetical protein
VPSWDEAMEEAGREHDAREHERRAREVERRVEQEDFARRAAAATKAYVDVAEAFCRALLRNGLRDGHDATLARPKKSLFRPQFTPVRLVIVPEAAAWFCAGGGSWGRGSNIGVPACATDR